MNKKVLIYLVLILAFAGVVYGVYTNKIKPNTMDINLHTESNSTVDNVSLKSSWNVNDGKLMIEYQIQNNSGSDIFVINKLPQTGNNNLNDAYAYVSAENGNLSLLVGISPALSVREVIASVPVGYTTVSKGQTSNFTVQLPLPIKEQNFYDDTDDISKFSKDVVKSAILHVEYKINQSDVVTKEISNAVSLTLPVEVRTDRFSRYGHTMLK